MIRRFLLQRKKILFIFSFITIAISVMALTFSQINKPITTRSKASEISPTPTISNASRKKGVGGSEPFKGAINKAYDLKISWFYNWAWLPFWGGNETENSRLNWNTNVWNDPNLEFVPMWMKKNYLEHLVVYHGGTRSCLTEENRQLLFNEIVERMNIICSTKKDYCKGRYHLIGNEPDKTGQDSDGINGTDLPGEAAACYGTIIRAIKSKDSTAKFIILGLSKEGWPNKTNWGNYSFLQSFFQKWKQIWNGTEIYDLPTLITGWDLHTYYTDAYYGNSYDSCPTNDSWPRNYLADIDTLIQQAFGKKVANQELWISEMGSLFNLPSRSNPTERNKFIRHMECLVNVYENSPIVTRYAWFYAGGIPDWEATSLYNQAPNSYCVESATPGSYCLTDLGEKYASLPGNISNSPTPGPTSNNPSPNPTNTPGPSLSPTLTPANQPTPTPVSSSTPTPAGSCTQFGISYKDRLWTATYTPQAITSSWWFGDNELRFSPSQKGKVDKVKLFVSWTASSTIRVKVTDLSHNNLTNEKVIYLSGSSSGTWKEFDFSTEPLVEPGTNYIITYRKDSSLDNPSANIYVHRGSYWKWAYEEWLKPCQ